MFRTGGFYSGVTISQVSNALNIYWLKAQPRALLQLILLLDCVLRDTIAEVGWRGGLFVVEALPAIRLQGILRCALVLHGAWRGHMAANYKLSR